MRDYDSEKDELIKFIKNNSDPDVLKIVESISKYNILFEKIPVYNVSIQESNNVK